MKIQVIIDLFMENVLGVDLDPSPQQSVMHFWCSFVMMAANEVASEKQFTCALLVVEYECKSET